MPASYVRDYFRSQNDAGWLPPLIEPFGITDLDTGEEVDTVSDATEPSAAEFLQSFGTSVPGELSQVGKVAGDIWYRETPYVQLQ